MVSQSAMSNLALYARDHFGEDGRSLRSGDISSLDVVMTSYVEESDDSERATRAINDLHGHFQRTRRSTAVHVIAGFVEAAMSFLRAVYPNPQALAHREERRLMSHLFWAHLVEARHAPGAVTGSPSGAPADSTKRRQNLVDSLSQALPRMYRAYERTGTDRRGNEFLEREIVRHADDRTLQRILEDLEQEIATVESR